VLIGAMIPMSTAFTKTGLTQAISDFLLTGLGEVGPHGLLAVIYAATSILTLFLSNTATAVLFTPIALQAALDMGVSPYPLLFAVAVSASSCFASPFSTPPNALVMSAGDYRFMDYVKVGLPLQIIMGVVMVLVLPWFFPF
jgi:di/tricarboxylate transporter